MFAAVTNCTSRNWGRDPDPEKIPVWKESIKILLENGANPNVTRRRFANVDLTAEQSVLMQNIYSSFYDPEITDMLLKHGADVNYIAEHKFNDISYGKISVLKDALTSNNKDALTKLVKHGVNINDNAVKTIVDKYDEKMSVFASNQPCNYDRVTIEPYKADLEAIIKGNNPEITMQFVNYAKEADNKEVLHDIAVIAESVKNEKGMPDVVRKEVMSRRQKNG